MGTAIVVIVLVLIVSAALRSIIKDRKNGKHCSCGGDCGHCGGCH